MDRGSDPAFPATRGGHQPEPGMSIREYISIEILAALIVAEKMLPLDVLLPAMVAQSFDAADLWLAEREKRTATSNKGNQP